MVAEEWGSLYSAIKGSESVKFGLLFMNKFHDR